MKIAMVFDGLPMGGIERVGVDYIKMMCRMGHDIVVINLNPEKCAMECEIPDNCKVYHIKYDKKVAPDILSSWMKNDFIHRCAYPVTYILMSIYAEWIKWFVVRRHISEKYDVLIAFSGHYNDLTFVAKSFIRTSKRLCWLHGALYGYALLSDGYLSLYRSIHNLVVLVDIFQGEVLMVNPWLKANIKKIYNPSFIGDRQVDSEMVSELHRKYGKFILMVGRLDEDKDQQTVIKAFKYLREKYGFENKLVFVGDGKKREELKTLVNEENLEEYVYFEGNRFDVQNYYSAAYLFVHSSPLEGLPTTLIEALYFELPIVASDSLPGVREILQDGKYGVIFPVGDYISMGELMYLMYTHQDVYLKYKSMCKERFADFSPSNIYEQLERCLEKLE